MTYSSTLDNEELPAWLTFNATTRMYQMVADNEAWIGNYTVQLWVGHEDYPTFGYAFEWDLEVVESGLTVILNAVPYIDIDYSDFERVLGCGDEWSYFLAEP